MTVEVSARIAAAPEQVWSLVADLSRMPEWSPEASAVEWLDGATAPAPGARFRGSNRNGVRRWSTTCTVVVADAPHEIAWRVRSLGMAVSLWRYRIEPDGASGSILTESAEDERGPVMRAIARPATGVADRAEHNRRTMAETLARIKAAAEV
jgi:uncharacterized protein YndB with AHSA1/START domain